MKKRILSSVLSLLMLMTCFSFTASVSTVSADDVMVYVNADAEENGTGTKDNPYNTFANAMNAVKTSGGTIVVMSNVALTNKLFTNTAKVTITSFDGTTDYRGTIDSENGTASGGCLTWHTGTPYDLNNGVGEIEFKNLNLVWFARYGGLNLQGRTFTFGTGTKWYEQKDKDSIVLVDDYSESLRLYNIEGTGPITKTGVTTLSVAEGSRVIKVITGTRCEITTEGHIFNVDGYIKELHLSTESNNNTSGKLTVDGDVKINIGKNGEVNKLTVATAPSANSKGLAGQKLLDKITGALAIAINHGGKITTNDISLTSTDYTVGKMIIVNGAENLTVKNGTASGSFVVESSSTEFNSAVITDASGNRIVKPIKDNKAEFILKEGGTYSATLEYIETPKYTVTFKDFDGSEKGSITAEEGTDITELPEPAFREGYEFIMWSVDGINPVTTVSAKNETANAIYRTETRKVVFVNGEVETAGDGKTPTTPYKDLAKAANAVADGGVIVVMGCTEIYKKNFANTEPVLLTSVYNGKDYRGELNDEFALEGAFLFIDINTPYTNTGANDGLIEFDNVNLRVRGQYCALNMGGHSFCLGEGFGIYEPTINSVTCETFRLAITFSIRAYDINTAETETETEILDSFIDGKAKISAFYLGTRGKKVIPGRNVVVNGNLGSLRISSDIKNDTQNPLTVKGDVKVTVNGTLDDISVTKIGSLSGLDKFEGNLSVIVGQKGSIGKIDDAAKPTKGKTVIVKTPAGASVEHTKNSLEYKITVDDAEKYNLATVSNGDDSISVILGDGSGIFSVSEEGEYNITLSKAGIYSVAFSDNLGGNNVETEYVKESEATEKPITLPTLSNTNTHRFLGWATSENAAEAQYSGNESYTVSGNVTLYAVWEEIPVFTITFREEDETKISDFVAFEGAKIVFPETTSLHKYGYTIIGWGEKNSDTPITTVPARSVDLYPIYKAKTGKDTVVYLNGRLSENGDGKTPETAFNHIQSAIDAVKELGGTVIVTDVTSFRNSTVSPQISPTYNNSGDIVFTSYDKETGIDYRAVYNADTEKFGSGAYIYYTNGINIGQKSLSGAITFENIILAKSKATYLNLDGHKVRIGEGVSVYQGTDTFKTSAFQIRGLGESGITGAGESPLDITLNGLAAGTYSFTVGGSGNATVNGYKLTVESAIAQGLGLGGNNSTLTVNGDILINLYASIGGFSIDGLNHESGNVTLILNNNTNAEYPAAIPEGYALRTVKCEDSFATLTHGKDASEIIVTTQPTMYTYVEVYTGDDKLYDTVLLDENHRAVLTLPEGSFKVAFTKDPAYSITFDTLCDEAVQKEWHEYDSEVTVRGGVKNLGYLFDGWKYGDTVYNEGDVFIMPKENVTFTAVWSVAPEITIALDNGKYGEPVDDIVNYIYEFATLPILSDESAHFIGWSDDPEATVGVLNIQLIEDKTYYAIWNEASSVYELQGRYSNVDGAYLVQVYLEGEKASSGAITLENSSLLTFAGVMNGDGVNADTASLAAEGDTVTVSWSALDEEYSVADSRLLFTVAYIGEKEALSTLLPEEKVFAVNESEIFAKAITEKPDITAYGTISGIVTIDSRNAGTLSRTSTAIYVFDADSDVVYSETLESVGEKNAYTEFEITLPEGEYTLKIVKSGYIGREIPINVAKGNLKISDSPLFGGDIVDGSGKGDGLVDIDDFIRVLRGFSEGFRANPDNVKAVDINEDGVINVTDLSIIKKKFSGSVSKNLTIYYSDDSLAETAQTAADIICEKLGGVSDTSTEESENSASITIDTSIKLRDWTLTRNGNDIEIKAGSADAIIHAVETFVSTAVGRGERVSVPGCLTYNYPYTLDKVNVAGNQLCDYSFVLDKEDAVANGVYTIINDYLMEEYGYALEVKSESGAESDKEILIGGMSSVSEGLENEYCEIKVSGSKLHIAYKGEYSPEIAAYDFIEQVVSSYAEGYDEDTRALFISDNYSYTDFDSVSSKFLLMSDTHVESDFLENGRDVYTSWKPDFQALTETYKYINNNFPELTFGLFCGDTLNTGYAYQAQFLNEERENHFRTLEMLNLHKNSKSETNLTEIFDFEKTESFVERNTTYYFPELNSRVITIQGNHDTGVEEFYRECAFTDGNTRFITFFASYVGLPAPAGTYKSTGKISDESVAFVEEQLRKAAADSNIEHIILACHWAISQDTGFVWPIFDACEENGYNDNRKRIIALAEEYGCDFYINGHEHNANYPIGKAGSLYNINIGSAVSRWAVVEIHDRKIVFDVYSTAVANTETGEIITPVTFVKRVTQSLTPKSILTR